jgi:hypothetical protein
MSDMEKKARLSGESPRVSEPGNTLPTVNVATEKPEPPKAALHPSVYVMYAAWAFSLLPRGKHLEWQSLHPFLQLLDFPFF